MLSIKSVNSLSHYTDWTIAHVHAGALGWNGFMTFGMIYWLMPRLFQTKLWSKKLAEWHFWIGTIGILAYIIPIYAAGVTQGLMWRAFDETGRLQYPDFVETVTRLMPMYWIRVIGGLLFIAGTIMLIVNAIMTWRSRPPVYDEPVHEAPALSRTYIDPPIPASRLTSNIEFGKNVDVLMQGWWHRVWERRPIKFTVWVVIAVGIASLFELIPAILVPAFSSTWAQANIPRIESVQPYTPLELAGRDIYIAEGCYNCHSQMIRPMWAETKRYGEFSKPGEFIYDHPFQWGSRRLGPDLHREGGRQSWDWHVRHFEDPRAINPQSLMPAYSHLLRQPLDFGGIQRKVDAMIMLGVPYGEAAKDGKAVEMARAQANQIGAELELQGSYRGLSDRKVIALIAYLQRVGTDLTRPAPTPATSASPAAPAQAPSNSVTTPGAK